MSFSFLHLLILIRFVYYLACAELKAGVYFSTKFSTIQKHRMVAGIMTEYHSMVPDDIVMFNVGDVLLVLVLPKIPNQVAWELCRPFKSNCQQYDLIPSINIILEHLTDTIRLQLTLKDKDVDDPLLQNFKRSIRLIGMFALIKIRTV